MPLLQLGEFTVVGRGQGGDITVIEQFAMSAIASRTLGLSVGYTCGAKGITSGRQSLNFAWMPRIG
ncbi:hypothetical protein, partial [Pseudomonas chlororaphis]|uniref:hypothetical protein n=1 Tax=Pseudomonas chlororaphis TaxID=587753 RepID=UPI001B33F021